MLRLLAIAFPALVLLGSFALLRPGSVLRRFASIPAPSPPGATRAPLAFHLAVQGIPVALTLALTPLLAVAHHALLVAAGGDPGAAYSHRLSDEWPTTVLVALFIASFVAFSSTVRILHAWLGDRLAPLLDEPGPGRAASSLRRQIVVAPRLAAAVGLLAVIFVAATLDNALVVRGGTFRFRPLFGAATEGRVDEIACLYVRTIRNRGGSRTFLELELRDGTSISPGNTVEGRAIAPAIAALQAQAPRRIRVRVDGQR